MKIAILGAGPGGYAAAVRAARRGGEVTLIEKDAPGGTCLNRGCIPSKIFRRAADILEDCRSAARFGVDIDGTARINMEQVVRRKEEIVAQQRKGLEALFKHAGIRLITGTGRLTGEKTLTVDTTGGTTESIDWDRLILAVGSKPATLPSLPIDGNTVITSNEALEMTRLPESMAIVGGGVIGCEFACLYAAFGVKVTVVEALDRLLPLPNVEPSVSKVLMRECKKQKINVILSHFVTGADIEKTGARLTLTPASNKGEAKEVTAERVLVCIGREPWTEDIGLAAAGVDTDRRGWITADMHMATQSANIFAVGDILGPYKSMLAHTASMEGIIAAENALGNDLKMDYDAIPAAVFTHPEVACAGLSATQARERGMDVKTETVLYRTIGKAQVLGHLAGEMKLVYEASSGALLGVHIIGARAAELIAEGTAAIGAGLTVSDIARTIHAHPTVSEIYAEAALKAIGVPFHG